MKYGVVSNNVKEIFDQIVDGHFGELKNVSILLVTCNKMRKSRGKIKLATIKPADEFTQFLLDMMNEEADYIVVLDKKVCDHVDPKDIKRILRHELRHVFYDEESTKPNKTVDHDYEDFEAEIQLNKDDPLWARRVAAQIVALYEEEKNQEG